MGGSDPPPRDPALLSLKGEGSRKEKKEESKFAKIKNVIKKGTLARIIKDLNEDAMGIFDSDTKLLFHNKQLRTLLKTEHQIDKKLYDEITSKDMTGILLEKLKESITITADQALLFHQISTMKVLVLFIMLFQMTIL